MCTKQLKVMLKIEAAEAFLVLLVGQAPKTLLFP